MRAPTADPKPRHWADRHYSPVEAAYAIAQYTDFNPTFFLQQCEAAGLDVSTDGKLIHFRISGDADKVDERQSFLIAWLRLDEHGKMMRTSLKRRGRCGIDDQTPGRIQCWQSRPAEALR